jgi:hypothetical protein
MGSDWLGMFVPRAMLRRRPVRESLNPPHEDDVERLAELRELGSRLYLPHPVRAYLTFAAEPSARQASDQLARDGYRCTVRAGQDGTWTVTAVTRMVPTPGSITRLREQLEALASTHEGSYHGWDAPAVY